MWSDEVEVLAELLPFGLLTLDAAGGVKGANGPGLELLGLDRRALAEGPLPDLLPEGALREALSAPSNGEVRLSFASADKTLHAHLRPMPGGEEGVRVLVLTDVSALSSSAHLKRTFVHEVMHKIRTPLTSILSVLSLATNPKTASPEQIPELLVLARREAEGLKSFLNQFRDLLVVEAGVLRAEAQDITFLTGNVLSRVVMGFRPRLESSRQIVREDYTEDRCPARGDPEFLARAFVHVLRNAHQHAAAEATIDVKVVSDRDGVHISVVDDGPGVSEEDLPRVFARFWRGAAATARLKRGAGLGLYLARHLMSVIDGSILLDSRPGEGTKVELFLRAAEGSL